MRGLQNIVPDASCLDGFELATPILSGCQSSEANPTRLYCLWLQIVRMVVFAVSVGLPDFKHRIIERRALAVQYSASQPNAFALYLRTGNALDAVLAGGQLKVEKWADSLRWSWNQIHIRPRTVWPQGRAARCRICSRWPIAAGWFLNRTWKPCAAGPFRPVPIDRSDHRQTSDLRENTFASLD